MCFPLKIVKRGTKIFGGGINNMIRSKKKKTRRQCFGQFTRELSWVVGLHKKGCKNVLSKVELDKQRF